MSIFRVKAVLNGFAGGPGLMYRYFSPAVAGFNEALAQLSVDRVRDAVTAGSALWPNTMSWAIDGTVDELDEASGTLLSSLTVTARDVPGSGVGNSIGPAPCGAVVNWKTVSIKRGRRVAGKTFLVPLANVLFQDNGTLTPAALTAAGAFASAMNDAGATDLVHVVWSRPVVDNDGTKHGITGFTVPDKVAVLRSRRD